MLTYIRKSILGSNAQTVVNTVNTVGVMGKGLAAEFKKRYPDMFRRYRDLCLSGKFQMGQLWLWKGPNQWVLNFPTKKHWRKPSQISYVEMGLKKFVQSYEERGITEIAFPRLGCGNGGLDWDEVRPLMEQYLSRLPIRVDIHDFEGNIGIPEHAEAGQEEFTRSFEGFLSELLKVVESRSGKFNVLTDGSQFLSFFKGTDLLIEHSTASSKRISQDELYEVWLSLLRGPVTENQLSGVALEEADYLIAVLAALRFVRPTGVKYKDQLEKIGVELLDRRSGISVASGEPCQATFEWQSLES